MNSKIFIWIGAVVGSFIGSFVPSLWGDNVFSVASLFFGAVGAIAGIYLGWKISRNYF